MRKTAKKTAKTPSTAMIGRSLVGPCVLCTLCPMRTVSMISDYALSRFLYEKPLMRSTKEQMQQVASQVDPVRLKAKFLHQIL